MMDVTSQKAVHALIRAAAAKVEPYEPREPGKCRVFVMTTRCDKDEEHGGRHRPKQGRQVPLGWEDSWTMAEEPRKCWWSGCEELADLGSLECTDHQGRMTREERRKASTSGWMDWAGSL